MKYDFHRFLKVKKDAASSLKKDSLKKDERIERKLAQPLEIEEVVPVLAERLKKKEDRFLKSTTKNKPLFYKDEIFVIRK